MNDPAMNKSYTLQASLYFFSIACLLQFILFLPLYLSRMDEGSFWPILNNFPIDIIARSNPDPFRWSLELAAMLSLWIIMPVRKWGLKPGPILAMAYTILFIFQCYYYFVWKIYGEIPTWSYDLALLKRVFPVFMKTMGLPPLLIFAGAIFLVIVLFILFKKIFAFLSIQVDKISRPHAVTLSLILFLIPFALKKSGESHPDSVDHKKAMFWIFENIHTTFTLSRVKSLPNLNTPILYDVYPNLKLKSKPNIYLIFIEAYGSIAGTVSPYDIPYAYQLKAMEDTLSSNAWHMATALSNSTILGGRSWLGFTTLLSGIRIDNHPAYEDMISHHVGYPHLINTLNAQGYHTYRLNTMANPGQSFSNLDSIAGLYFNVGHWTRYHDIPYRGYRYDYMGGIPDQYALNFWHDQVLNKSTSPNFLFFITLNTHAPFYLPPPITQNWKDLDAILTSPNGGTRLETGPPIKRYSKEVSYILNVLKKFILENGNANSLFILMGDHQPAGMEYMLHGKTDTYATPIHLISKDRNWIDLFREHGFTEGMVPDFKPHSPLKHEGFYSLFMNIWAQKDSLSSIPAYLPDGIR